MRVKFGAWMSDNQWPNWRNKCQVSDVYFLLFGEFNLWMHHVFDQIYHIFLSSHYPSPYYFMSPYLQFLKVLNLHHAIFMCMKHICELPIIFLIVVWWDLRYTNIQCSVCKHSWSWLWNEISWESNSWSFITTLSHIVKGISSYNTSR